MRIKRRNRTRGNAIAEMPGAIWLFIIGFLIPLIGFVTLSYRVVCFYNAVRDCVYQASIEQTYTEAEQKAKDVLDKDCKSFTGITCNPNSDLVLKVVEKSITGSAERESGKKAPNTIDTTNNRYFLRVYVNASVLPLFNIGPSVGMFGDIPGLTGPIPIRGMMYQVYAENPNGLES